MAVWTEERKIGQAAILPIAIDVLNFDRNLACLRVAL
jgi:hypothetical protein